MSVVGTRPNFMKVAPIATALRRRGDTFEHVLVHTGQHYDTEMSSTFLAELGGLDPDIYLDVGSGTHAQTTARVLERLESALIANRPDLLLVVGDVDSTLAAGLAATKLGIPVG